VNRRKLIKAAATGLLVGTLARGNGQTGNDSPHLKPVTLNLIATDHAGHPVTDLRSEDLRVLDDGAQQPITSLRLNPTEPAPTLVVLFDLLDLSFRQAGYQAEQLRKSLANLKTSDPLYLYILVANGSLFPVHAVPGSDEPRSIENADWIENAGPLLNQALEKVNQARSVEFVSHPDELFQATYSALDAMRQELARVPGRKQLLWITDGIPSSIRFAPGWVDLAPRLRQLGALFNGNDIAIYTLDPSLSLATLDRQGLEVLSAATGGRTLISSDLKKAIQQTRMDARASYELEYAAPLTQNAVGKLHTVRISSNRKGVGFVSEAAYFAELESVKAVAPVPHVSAPVQFSPAVPIEPGNTFVGIARTVDSQSMVLELEDNRFIIIDFKERQRFDPHPGDRISVRGGEYDGHGLVAESMSLMEAATPASTAPEPAQPVSVETVGDPVITQAREAEAKADRALPNFLCKEIVRRYEGSARQKDWQPQDTLSAEVLYSRQQGETYRDIRVNGKPTGKRWAALGGDVSTGEFGSLLHSVLANHHAQFQFIKEDTVNGVTAREYGFRIERTNSDWKILTDYQYIVSGYRGHVWFAQDTNSVLRIDRTAEDIPSAFPLSSAEAEVTFGEIRLGPSQSYQLPQQGETRVCIRDRNQCSRKTIGFRDYRQFIGDAKITY